MLMKKLEESPFVPKFARLRGCRPAAFYLLLLAVVSVAAAQCSVDPTTGGLAGFVGSAVRLPPSGTWAILGALGGWIAGTMLVASIAKRALHGDGRRAAWRRALVAAGSALSAGLAGALYAVDGDLQRAVVFWGAPAAGAVILLALPRPWRVVAAAGITAGAALVVVGLILTPNPRDARAGTDISAFAGQDRVYVERVISADTYGCGVEFKTHAPLEDMRDYLSQVISIEPVDAETRLMRARISNWMRLPSYTVSVHLTKETSLLVRPEYLVVCLTDGPERRADEIDNDGLPYPAPWRWRRSADGGASWADVPHNPHRESDETAGYAFRHVPTRADLADENVRLRACVNVRGGGEVCSAGARPSP